MLGVERPYVKRVIIVWTDYLKIVPHSKVHDSKLVVKCR